MSKWLAAMPRASPPPDAEPAQVVVCACADTYPNGIYPIRSLAISDLDLHRTYPAPAIPLEREPSDEAFARAFEDATFAVVAPACYPMLGAVVSARGYRKLCNRNRLELYARRQRL